MSKLLSVHTAEAADIWPDGSGLSAEAEREIMELAKTVSQADIDRSNLVFSRWYIPFVLAEHRWKQRQQQKAEQQHLKQVTENDNASRIAKIERRLASTSKDVNFLLKTLFSPPKSDPKGEMTLFRLIKNIAWQQNVERKVMRDAGIWNAEKLYDPGAAVTHDGQLWVAQQESKGVAPGDGVAWRLTQKSDLAEVRHMVRDAVRVELHKQMKGTSK